MVYHLLSRQAITHEMNTPKSGVMTYGIPPYKLYVKNITCLTMPRPFALAPPADRPGAAPLLSPRHPPPRRRPFARSGPTCSRRLPPPPSKATCPPKKTSKGSNRLLPCGHRWETVGRALPKRGGTRSTRYQPLRGGTSRHLRNRITPSRLCNQETTRRPLPRRTPAPRGPHLRPR